MTNCSKAAKLAVEKMVDGTCTNPRDAWTLAISKFSDSLSVQNKPCPKGAFLGLCQEGLVQGIEPGDYTPSDKNKEYALKAVKKLKELEDSGNHIASDITALELWRKIGETKAYNQQMDVVLSLWINGFINKDQIK